MKTAVLVLVLIVSISPLFAETVVQTGIESYLGTNRMLLWTPWLGIRQSLSASSSLLFKCYFHNLAFRYIDMEEQEAERTANLLNLTGAYYAQGQGREYYGALSFFRGTDGYSALALDAGYGFILAGGTILDVGIYALNESSILWHPEEPLRRITTASVKGGIRLRLFEWLRLNPRFSLYRNTDGVTSSALAVSLVLVPRPSLYLSLGVSRYSESAAYRFQGDYIEIGLNYYR